MEPIRVRLPRIVEMPMYFVKNHCFSIESDVSEIPFLVPTSTMSFYKILHKLKKVDPKSFDFCSEDSQEFIRR